MWEKKDDEMQRSTISIVVLSLESFSEIWKPTATTESSRGPDPGVAPKPKLFSTATKVKRWEENALLSLREVGVKRWRRRGAPTFSIVVVLLSFKGFFL